SRPASQENDQNMGQFSVEIYSPPGSALSGNQHLVVAVNKVGGNVNQIARRLNIGDSVSSAELRSVYADLLSLVKVASS
ncbi:plasmid mobilization relaxosome protein MobC, partial [Pacificimonas flava]|uniref:plasmid mobilization relaxosome protein MobC n=1 Tax=Pacificimonas flava TaxID=1234595 RepID=UPI001A9C6A04